MPQLETSTYITQIFWLFVTFMCFWVIMAKFIVPKISEMVEKRKRKYDDFVIKAEELNKKTLYTLKKYEETLAVAKKQAANEIEKNERQVEEFIRYKEVELDKQIQLKISESERQLQNIRSEVINQMDNITILTVENLLPRLNIETIVHEDIKKVVAGEPE